MFSIVCVFNDAGILKNRLLSSLGPQDQPYELITVDNVSSRFDRAAKALNWGAARAHGDWLIFAHQDINFLSSDWLTRAEGLLESSASRGWHGVAGVTTEGKLHGFMLDRAMLLGHPLEDPVDVQTLDECLLLCRRQSTDTKYFDESVPGWHAYGVEACCSAIRAGARNYVLPLPIWHDSKSTNIGGLEDAHRYVWEKHGAAFGRIATTCGDLPLTYSWPSQTVDSSLGKFLRRAQHSFEYRFNGDPGTATNDFQQRLESMTESEGLIECLHSRSWHPPITAKGFVQFPSAPRTIVHRFEGYDFKEVTADCIVIAEDLDVTASNNLDWLNDIRKQTRRLVVCADWRSNRRRRKSLRTLMSQAKTAEWTRHWDGTARAILEFQRQS